MPTSTQVFRLVGKDDASKAFLEVAAASRLLKSNMDDVSSSVLGLGKLVGGTSLVPLLAGTTAAVTELTTALGAAAGAGGVFGLSVGGFLVQMKKQQTTIAATQKSLANYAKGTTQYSDTLTKLHLQQRSFQQDFGVAAKGYDNMTGAFQRFLDATGPVTKGDLAKGFNLVASVLPKLVPVSNAAGQAVGGLIDDLSNWTDSPEFAHLLDFLETSGPRDITAFGHIIGNVVGGLGGILSNFVGPGDHAAKTLEHLTADFDKWGHSKGVSKDVDSFLRYVGNNGPALSSSFESLAEASPKIATALGQLGSANLTLTSKFLSLVAGLPQKQFNLIADGLFAMAAGAKALTLVTGLGAVGKGLAGLLSGGGLLGKSKSGGGILGSAGVQKVFVVNMPPGGIGGGGGPRVPGGLGGAAGGVGGSALAARLGLATAEGGPTGLGLAVVAAVGTSFDVVTTAAFEKEFGDKIGGAMATAFRGLLNLPDPHAFATQLKVWKSFFTGGPGAAAKTLGFSAPKGNTALSGAALSVAARNGGAPNFPRITPEIKSAGTAMDALNARLSKASAGMDLVGHSAATNFLKAGGYAGKLSDKVNTINGSKASAAMDLVGHSATTNFLKAQGQADAFKTKLNGIPDKTVKINADTGQAESAVQSVKAALASIERVVNVHVNVTRNTNATLADVNTPRKAGGGSVFGPGSGTSDSILAYLSNGEYVVNAQAAKRYRALLDQINFGHYANGGPVGAGRWAGSPIHVTVEAPVGADGYTIGETLKGYLDTYLNGTPT